MSIKIIGKVKSGELSLCTKCNHYHLTFNNVFFEFTKKEFIQFKKFIFELDTAYWNKNYPSSKIKRNIPIPTLQGNLIILFNQIEINELKKLFSYQFYQRFQRISSNEVDYKFMDN
tara:strand:- start:992 stop:1339 length:348 start_codon:yes stop_codon:yes gene_type:complete